MHGDFSLVEITIVALAALSCGVLLERIKQPAVLGYIVAGVILGPSMFGLVENRELIDILAELGVLMLLFLIGLELDLREFKKVWHIALSCHLLQIISSLAVVLTIGWLFSLPIGLTVLLGFAIALSSTAVAFKMTESIGELKTSTGRLTIGVLIAQDLAVVPMILVLQMMSTESFDVEVLAKLVLSIGLLALLIWFFGKRQKIEIPFAKILADHADLTPLLSLAFCFLMATLSGLFGLSAPYGAFLAGLILGNTTHHSALMKATKPIQSVFMMVFFLSIGLMLDLPFLWQHLLAVILLLSFITLGKSFLNVGILRLLGCPWPQAFLAGLLLAQMGEFAFLLATVGDTTGLIDREGRTFVISLAALSLTFSPLWLAGARRIHSLAPRRMGTFKESLEAVYGREMHGVNAAWKSVRGGAQKSANWAQTKVKRRTENKNDKRAAKKPEPTKSQKDQ
ncbi:MAG: cation:proton antiporter [Pseudomonadota bacterium]